MILLVSDGVGSMGGTRTFLFNVIEENNCRKIETKLCIPKNSINSDLISFCKKFNIEILCLPNRIFIFRKPFFSILYDFFIYFKIIFNQKPKLILATIGSPGNFYSFLFLFYPIVYYLHTYPYKWSNRFFDKSIISFFMSKKAKIVTVSEYSRAKLVKHWNVKPGYVNVIYNGVRVPTLSSSFEDVVLTVGHVVDYKNPLTWIKVAKIVIKEFPSIKFLWAGDGVLLESMRNIVIENKLKDNVFFLGLVNDLAPYYKMTSIYFHPSLIESHGISIIEAMSFRIPCVASNVGGIPESLNNGISGFLLDPMDFTGFAEKISFLLSNRDISIQMGSLGYEKFLKSFTYKQHLDKVCQLYSI
jgi:glycosyltransferase involved in cell wall biosynthesis